MKADRAGRRDAGAGRWAPREAHLARTRLDYLEAGDGEPILFLHGWAGFKEIWWGTLRAVSDRFRGIALDWPGHGRSPARPDGSLGLLAELAAESCADLGIARVTVVGHSMGGRVAALIALLHPRLVGRLVLVSPVLDPAHLAPYARRVGRIQEVERTLTLARWLGHGLGLLVPPARHDHAGGVLRPFLRRAQHAGRAEPRTLHRHALELQAQSLDDRLVEIRQPTLVVAGRLDPLVLPRQARRAAEAIPNARLHVIRGALHTPMDERPAEFRRVLLDFLDGVPSARVEG